MTSQLKTIETFDLDHAGPLGVMLALTMTNLRQPSTAFEGARGFRTMSCRNGAVAVVDDDAAVCDSTRIMLEAYGYEVRIYLSGAEFLRDGRNIACLVVDYRMPGLNGFDLVSELRTRGASMPTIMITATSDPSVERRAAELGIKRVLHKPLATRVLMNAINDELE